MKYSYLVVSDNLEDISHADLIVVQNFDKAQEKLKKKVRSGAGLEVQILQAKSMDAKAAAKWLVQVRELYQFCKLARYQLVISSGATSPHEMVSGRCLDALLVECGISPAKQWVELEKWVESRFRRRVTV